MVGSSYLVSTALMGLLFVGLVSYIILAVDWRRDEREGVGWSTRVESAIRSPLVWTAAFLVLAFELGLGVVILVGGLTVSPAVRAAAGGVVAGTAGLVFAAFFLFGVYRSARFRGLKSAQAAGMGSGLVGILFVAAIVLKLIVA